MTDGRALITEAQRGSARAAKILTERLSPVIHARVRRVLARSFGRSPVVDATDLANEVWLSLVADGWRRLLAHDPERGASLEGYVGILAEHEALNRLEHLRAAKRGGKERHVDAEEADRVPARGGTPEEVLVASELAERLEHHLAGALPERGRLILRYLYTDGRSADEVAEILGVEKQVVYNWQHKIRQLARTFLARPDAPDLDRDGRAAR